MTRLHLPHAIVVRLCVGKTYVVILTPKTVGAVIGKIFHPWRNHGCYPVRATGGSLPCGRKLPAPLTGNNEGSKGLMVLQVKPTPMDNTSLHSIPSVWHPWGVRCCWSVGLARHGCCPFRASRKLPAPLRRGNEPIVLPVKPAPNVFAIKIFTFTADLWCPWGLAVLVFVSRGKIIKHIKLLLAYLFLRCLNDTNH